MTHHRATLCAVLVTGAAAAAGAAGPEAAASPPAAAALPSMEQLADPEWIAEGRKRFISACAYCHGQEGQAGKTRSFKERPGWDPVKIHEVITNGRARAGNVMPAWKGSIPDGDIWKIVAYVKSLTPAEPAGPLGKP